MKMSKFFYLNSAQIRTIANQSKIKIDLWPRGTGKSTSLAFRIQQLAYECPRGKHLIVGRTYQQLQTRTLPPVFAELERLGYIKDIHFFFGKRPDKRLGIPEPFEPLLNYENCIIWHTGACFMLVSQDRVGMARGINSDSLTADEAITLKKMQLDEEVIPTIRANVGRFKSRIHHSISYCSSKPSGTEGKWLIEYGDYYEDLGLNYREKQRTLVALQLEFLDAKTLGEQQRIWTELIALTIQLNYFPIKTDDGSLFYNEAHVFENIRNLGINYIRRARRTMGELLFLVEILNLTLMKVEGGFYASFDEDKHGDDWFDYDYLDQFNFDFKETIKLNDCRADWYNKNEPLDIACDYNAAINSMVVGQYHFNNEYRVLNALFVKSPLLSKHNAKQFCDYYQNHPCKEVNYFYDHTAIGRDASRDFNHVDEVCKVLEQHGWSVKKIYLGQAKTHHYRYNFYNRLFQEEDHGLIRLRFFRSRTKQLIVSLQNAKVKQGKEGFEKDKRSEQSKMVAPEDATHFSEALDTLVQGVINSYVMTARPYVPVVSG